MIEEEKTFINTSRSQYMVQSRGYIVNEPSL